MGRLLPQPEAEQCWQNGYAHRHDVITQSPAKLFQNWRTFPPIAVFGGSVSARTTWVWAALSG
jgi:hypothetical protein